MAAGCWLRNRRVVFSSHIFVYYFLPIALLGYYALVRAPQRWRNFWLILTGYTFYGWAEPRFMPLLFATPFVDFSCFVSMFPHLVAGPILKFSFLADQMKHRRLTSDKFARGVAFFMLGLAKKILLANPCGKIADVAFNAGSVHTSDAWFGALGYSFQIYFDFSGYSDMAIGLGLIFGFVFAKNFDSPYRPESITDLWRRWHSSLSTWLR